MSRRQTGFPLSVRVMIIERAQGRCERCGEANPGMQVHHRRPRGMGGSRRDDTNTAANGVYVDAECHAYIESHREEALRQGWLLRQTQHPHLVPIVRRGVRVFLNDSGTITEEAA